MTILWHATIRVLLLLPALSLAGCVIQASRENPELGCRDCQPSESGKSGTAGSDSGIADCRLNPQHPDCIDCDHPDNEAFCEQPHPDCRLVVGHPACPR